MKNDTKRITVNDLSLDEKIGQLFVPGAHGRYMSESSAPYRTLLHHVNDNKVGGFIWFVSNVYETAHLNTRLQKASRIPLLISADLEAGVGMRFLDTTYWPTAMAVAATGDPKFAEEQGRVVARDAKALGINHILAPVVDVNVDPDNPVINARSFGEDPQEVSRFISAFIRGVQSEGLLATAKHFPGHGATAVDSHRSLPVLNVTRERLDQVELVPFRAAIAAGVKSVMIGHLALPVLDATPAPIRERDHYDNPWGTEAHEVPKEGTIPATLSRPIIEGLLRKELGFTGLVVSDAFDMGGLTEHFDPGEAAVRGIEAGEDQILMSPNPDAAVAAVREAVRSGRISEARIDESVRRILAVKENLPYQPLSPDEIFREFDTEADRLVAADIARKAITLVREESGALPLRVDQKIVLVTVADSPDPLSQLPELDKAVKAKMAVRPQMFTIDGRTRSEETVPILEAARRADVVVFALAIRAKSGAGQVAVPAAARELIEKLAPQTKTIGVAFGSPYLLREVAALRTYLCAYGVQPVMQIAALNALFGEAPISGRLPVSIPGLYARGHGLQK